MKLFRIIAGTVLFFTVCISAATAQPSGGNFSAKQGVADLRNQQFQQSINLSGEWAFAWQKLLTPSDSAGFNSFTGFPGIWNNKTVKGVKLSAMGYATYGLTIFLPKGHPSMALHVPDVYSSHKLYVNGELSVSNGVTATSGLLYKPHWEPHTVVLPAGADTIKLMFQVANFSHSKGGPSQPFLIGETSQLMLDSSRSIANDFLLAGCLFMGGLFFFGLYHFGTQDKATLYFSLFCMLYSYRLIGSSTYSLHQIYPVLSWQLAIRLEYISLFGSIFLFLQYVRNLYPKDFYKPVMRVFSAASGLLGVLPLITTPEIFTSIINPFLIGMFFCIAYLMFVFIKAYLNKRIAAGYALASIAVLMVVQLIVNLEYFGIIVPSKLVLFIGYVVFFFLQSLILSFRFAYRLKKARTEAEQGLKSKSEFLSTMSHEIRTPLNSVIGMTNLMLQNQPRADQQEQLNVLKFSSNNLLCIVNDILDFNKIEAGKIRFENIDMDVREILNNIVSGVAFEASEKGIGMHLQAAADLNVMVKSDPTRLAQVINNLAGNAVKFTQKGSVTVSYEVTASTKENVTLLFKIKDTGIGIPKNKQRLIFERFTQADSTTSRSFGGTGLGLAICKKILELQGSELKLESEEGQGSLFYFELTFPLSHRVVAKESPPKEVTVKTDKPLEGITILLVEDNQINILVAKTFLESWGATIDVAENGQEAIEMLDTDRHALVLMDMHMPVMDGFTAVNIIRGNGIRIPIIALTASLPGEVEPIIRGLDLNDFVLKPFSPDDLLQKVMHHSKAGERAVAVVG